MKNNRRASHLYLSEIFLSLQGEGSRTGEPCVFVRLAGCSLGCRWCDTGYARTGGKVSTIGAVLKAVKKYAPVRQVLVTGGEPLEQPEAVISLLRRLLKEKYEVAVETNGAESIDRIPSRVLIILDVKTPSSYVSDRNLEPNLALLRKKDELKFVIADRKDFDWSVRFLKSRKIRAGRVFFSAVDTRLRPETLGRWILAERLPVQLMLRLHKILRMK
jgi:7-carboxy-7-deazaguanine synthase